jgi:hypothetical protein
MVSPICKLNFCRSVLYVNWISVGKRKITWDNVSFWGTHWLSLKLLTISMYMCCTVQLECSTYMYNLWSLASTWLHFFSYFIIIFFHVSDIKLITSRLCSPIGMEKYSYMMGYINVLVTILESLFPHVLNETGAYFISFFHTK